MSRCPYAHRGCTFTGTDAEVDDHVIYVLAMIPADPEHGAIRDVLPLARLSTWPCGACGTDVNAGQLTARQLQTAEPALGAWEVTDGQPTRVHEWDRCQRAQR